jgi:NAD(P)-dependent dehydrogenase (short-subunit alcohol dehydrogenase family)
MSPSAISNGDSHDTMDAVRPRNHIDPTTDAPTFAERPTEVVSTEPPADYHWRVTLENKVIAITGANRGLGIGIAEVCLANGAAAVYSLDLLEPSDDFNALAKKSQGRFRYLHCDVTSEESIATAIERIIADAGSIHGLVANAGMTKHQAALDFTREQLDKLFNLNVYGAYFCATAAARAFMKLGVKGSIVFTSSKVSYGPNRATPSAPYGGTKAAVRNMTHTMAMEWAPHGIRVNSVSPGFVRTAMTYHLERSEDFELKMKYYGGMPRLADPKELGGAYVYLLSDCASYTSGIDIPVAGVVGAW